MKFQSIIAIAMLNVLALIWGGCAADWQTGCDYDSECWTDEYCIESACVQQCSHDEDCTDGVTCEVFQRTGESDPIQACLISNNDGSTTNVDCETDRECREALDDESAYCGMHKRCIRPGSDDDEQGDPDANDFNGDNNQSNSEVDESSARHFLVIEQIHPADFDDENGDNDGNLDDNGIDESEGDAMPLRVGAVIVRDDEGAAVAYGQVRHLEPEETTYGTLLEAPLTLDDAGICPAEPESSPYISLGAPGGLAVMDFQDGTDRPIQLEPSWRLHIIADSPECRLGQWQDGDLAESGTAAAKYRLSFCISEDELPSLETDCTEVLDGPFSGFSDMEVTIPE